MSNQEHFQADSTKMLKIGSNISKFSAYSCHPKTKDELRSIIKSRIDKDGYECDLNDIDVSLITCMSSLCAYSSFNGDISNWDVSNVTDMWGMFSCSSFTGDISNWDVSKVEDMSRMFQHAHFKNDISNWKLRQDCDTVYMFFGCPIKEEYKPKLPNDQDWKESLEVLDLFLHSKEQV